MKRTFARALVVVTVALPSPLVAASADQPFRNLFPNPLQPRAQAPPPKPLFAVKPTPSAPSGARVVCGTVVVPVDPAFDAAIRRPAPDARPRPSSRSVPAPACEQPSGQRAVPRLR